MGGTPGGSGPPEHLFAVGKVLGTWGNRGMVKVWPLTDFPERVAAKEQIWLWREDTGARPAVIREGRVQGKLLVLGFQGIADMNAAETLRGSLVMVDGQHLEKLPADSYWHHDLVGMTVVDEAGEVLGTLGEIWSLPANDVFVVRAGERELLVPAVREFVLEVDPAGRRMRVRVPREERKEER